MCGRYSNHVKAMLAWEEILGRWPQEIAQSHNIAPGQMIAAFSQQGGFAMRWGMLPPWSNEPSTKYSTFNARIETVADKPLYRNAWRESRRCLIPALGYYEWQAGKHGKQPYFIHSGSGEPLLFAGLYEPAKNATVPISCTMLTREANQRLEAIHPRMPVVLSLESSTSWFGADPDEAMQLVLGNSDAELDFHPVSRQVNNARNQADDLIQPIELSQ